MPIDYEKELNEEQLAAVRADDGPVLVIAAAGTGKTRTLVYRVAWLVEQGVPGNHILLLTFTNKAANEMMERARERVGSAVNGMWGGTFHSVANRMLRQHAELLGYRRDYTILDADDQKKLCKTVVEELGHKGDKNFPKPDVLLSLFSLAANKNEDPEELVTDRFADHGIAIEPIMKVYHTYVARKKELNAMDFDDLLVNAVKLLEDHEGPRRYYQHQFRYVLVDEYQDTNPVQASFVSILSFVSRNLLVVGDDFQSIYSWRGADYRNILHFPEQYPDAQRYELVTNYRSSPEILDVANRCIAGNPEQFQKELKAVRENLGRPTCVRLQNGSDQARYIVQKVRELRREGYKYSDISILYRSHFHAMELQLELNRSGLPHVITSGVRFFEQAHVKDVLSVLRLAQNPMDELAFSRLVCLLPGVADRGAQKMWQKLGRKFNPLLPLDRETLLGAIPKRGQEAWNSVNQALEEMQAQDLLRNPGEMVRLYLEAFYDQYAVENFDNYPRRLEDIEGMIAYCAQFAHVEEFLNELALQTNLDDQPNEEEEAGESIRLGTVHQSKGLEYPVVFVIWCVESMFPSSRSLEESDGGESEERRLFYVASTRAKDRLFLCVPTARRTRDGGLQFYTSSRFISELGPELLVEEKGGYY